METLGKRIVFLLSVLILCIAQWGVALAQSDLDEDGIPDIADPETIVLSDTTLVAGAYEFRDLIITNNAVLTNIDGLASLISMEGHLTISGNAITAAASAAPFQVKATVMPKTSNNRPPSGPLRPSRTKSR